MKKDKPVLTLEDVDEDEIARTTYAATPLDYLRYVGKSNEILPASAKTEYGPAQVSGALFICPDCDSQEEVLLHAIYGTDEDLDYALIQCPNCQWMNTQKVMSNDR